MQLKTKIPKKNKSKKILFYLTIWFISIVLTSIWTFENPEKIELIKNTYKKNTVPISKKVSSESIKIETVVIETTKLFGLINCRTKAFPKVIGFLAKASTELLLKEIK